MDWPSFWKGVGVTIVALIVGGWLTWLAILIWGLMDWRRFGSG